MTFKATYLGSNGWIIDFTNFKIIIDPWLIGDLIFPPGEWFFKGHLIDEISIPRDINLILLTQGLPDHCHIPSLDKFSKNIDIICPKSAYEIVKKLNYKSIQVISPSEKITYKDLEIEATSGAPVPIIQNGYIVKNSKGSSFYIEPHGFLDKNLKKIELDAVITPTKNLELPFLGPFVKGADVIPNLINTFSPKYILSSTIGGEAKYSGFLNKFISIKEYKEKLSCKLIELQCMETIEI